MLGAASRREFFLFVFNSLLPVVLAVATATFFDPLDKLMKNLGGFQAGLVLVLFALALVILWWGVMRSAISIAVPPAGGRFLGSWIDVAWLETNGDLRPADPKQWDGLAWIEFVRVDDAVHVTGHIFRHETLDKGQSIGRFKGRVLAEDTDTIRIEYQRSLGKDEPYGFGVYVMSKDSRWKRGVEYRGSFFQRGSAARLTYAIRVDDRAARNVRTEADMARTVREHLASFGV